MKLKLIAAKQEQVNWSKYETVPYAVLIHSSESGWIEAARPTLSEKPFKRYEAFDCAKKMLLNYGMIVAETSA